MTIITDDSALHLFGYVLAGSIASLLPIINPLGVVPLFLSLTSNLSAIDRHRVARRVGRNAIIVLFVSLFFGATILSFFNISLGALTLSGGLVLAYLGFRLLFPDDWRLAVPHSPDQGDPSFVPLAFPGLTGAGTMAMVMGWWADIASLHSGLNKASYVLAVSMAFFVLGAICYFVLREAHRLTRLLGEQGINGLSRIMGLFMVCIGVQLIAQGGKALVSAL